jgi:hypothetical protein
MDTPSLCYLLAFPDPAETMTPPEQIRGLKDAPYFQAVDIHVHVLGQETIEAEGVQVAILRQRYDGRVQVIECHFCLPDMLSIAGIQQRERIEMALKDQLVPPQHRASGLFEEYIVLLLQNVEGTPDEFIARNGQNLARFTRSQREAFDQEEVDESLLSRVRYSKGDLTLVDWEGAVIIAPQGDFQSDIELLKIGNYQLLRYRILDRSIENSLRQINEEFQQGKRARFGPTRGSLRRIVKHRLELMLDFEHTEQNLLLIGDWYTAKLYHIILDEFYLDNWKEAVKAKLDNLEGIISTIQENFSLSWSGLMERAELIGWLILLIGYFILFFMESSINK